MFGRRSGSLGIGLSVMVVLGACAVGAPGYRSLHEVDGEVVASSPPPPVAYESYLRARLALEQRPPQLDVARRAIARALRSDPRDPHLWATRAEIEEQAGERDKARSAAERALSLRPGYPPAQRVLARLRGEEPPQPGPKRAEAGAS